jgi:hypothetical protein
MVKKSLCVCVCCLLGIGQIQALSLNSDADQRTVDVDNIVAGVEAYLDPANNAAWGVLSQLSVAEWAVLQFMLNAQPNELDAFIDDFSDSDRIYVLPDGSFSNIEPDRNSAEWRYIKVVSLRGVIDQIRSIVSTINSRAANIQGRLPANTPAIRDLFQQLSPVALRDLLVLVQDILGPTLDLVAAQREGFEQFRIEGVFSFRTDLHLMLNNLTQIWDSSQQLVCLTRPAYVPVPLEFSRLRRLIDQAPPTLLYGLLVALEQIEFDWRLSDLTAELQLEPFCDGQTTSDLRFRVSGVSRASSISPDARQGFQIRRCNFLRNQDFFGEKGTVAAAKVIAEGLAAAAEYSEQVEKVQKDDQVVQASAVAVGGGGAGVNFKNPLKVAAAITTFVLEQATKVLERALDLQQSCEDADNQREVDLLACRARVNYVLPDGDIVFLDDLVSRRIDEVEGAGLDLQDADTARDMATNEANSRQAFVCMCDAYQRLVLPSDQLPRVNCVEDPSSGSGGPGKP